MHLLPLKIQISTLPNSPGVYQFYDVDDKILYVGKAKYLKKRVSSYFHKTHVYGKTRVLVKKIDSLKHIIVKTESDALLLENNLIKKYQPRSSWLLPYYYFKRIVSGIAQRLCEHIERTH